MPSVFTVRFYSLKHFYWQTGEADYLQMILTPNGIRRFKYLGVYSSIVKNCVTTRAVLVRLCGYLLKTSILRIVIYIVYVGFVYIEQ